MSATLMKPGENPAATAIVDPSVQLSQNYYRGFVAGVFSGIAKLSGTTHPLLLSLSLSSTALGENGRRDRKALTAAVGHPFDTVKVRLQTTSQSQFKGPLDCLLQTVRNEGVRGLYKGASPPLVGWMFMDSM